MAKKSLSAKPASASAAPQANPIWGKHFAHGPAAAMAAINSSIDFDWQLYAQDIAGSIAHAEMLAAQKIISTADAEKIVDGLNNIKQEIESGAFVFKAELEDIHMNIEARLAELIGDAAGRLHTARSRNDQVATSFRLYVRDAAATIIDALIQLQTCLLSRAEEHADAVMPGFTHLQPAQPVTLGHHLMAYVEMFARDTARFEDAYVRMNECPLGAGALAGTSFPLDRDSTARALGFSAPTANSIDSVSDRDFALEFLACASIAATHLSRLAEELVIWSGPMRFIKISDAFTSGSSIMPQKRNPDAAELIRGKTGRINGNLVALLTVMKGLPLAYNKDTQEDKEPVFDTAKTLSLCLKAASGMVADFTADKRAMAAAASAGYSTATDLADWLVQHLDIPFRQAHHTASRIVKIAEENKYALSDVPLAVMQQIEPGITDDIYKVLTAAHSVAGRTSHGGTAPAEVRKAIAAAKERLA